MPLISNPFEADADRAQIWRMLVERDIAAFVAGDWALVEPDFIATEFLGVDARKSADLADWGIGFPTLAAYRDEWLRQAAATAATVFAEDVTAAIHRATRLERIDIQGDRATALKRFDGAIAKADGGAEVLHWQTLYFCRKLADDWRLTGFVGYMPYVRLVADGR